MKIGIKIETTPANPKHQFSFIKTKTQKNQRTVVGARGAKVDVKGVRDEVGEAEHEGARVLDAVQQRRVNHRRVAQLQRVQIVLHAVADQHCLGAQHLQQLRLCV
jgi:hypothetical protein